MLLCEGHYTAREQKRDREMAAKKVDQILPSLGGTLGFGETQLEPFCVACAKRFPTQQSYQSHLPGATHRTALQQMGRGPLFGCEKLYAHIDMLLEPVKIRQLD